AIVDRGVAVALGEMDDHETAAADVAGARIGDREREADRDRRVDGIAATVENLDADAGGALLLRDNHAVMRVDALRRRDERCRSDRMVLRRGNSSVNQDEKGNKNAGHRSLPAVPAKGAPGTSITDIVSLHCAPRIARGRCG